MNKLICPNCKSEKLSFYREKTFVYLTPITKEGKIPKKEKINNIYDNHNYIECDCCSRAFTYKIDSNGNITILSEL